MSSLLAVLSQWTRVPCSDPGAAWYGTMMDGGACGTTVVSYFVGVWTPILFALAVLAGVAWVILRNRCRR